MDNLDDLKSLANELVSLLGTDLALTESVLYTNRLRERASDAIQNEQLDRYVAGIFGYRWEAWRSNRDAFLIAESKAEGMWAARAKAELSRHAFDGLVGADVSLVARQLSASLLVEVAPVTSRKLLLNCAEWLRNASALLTACANERPVGAREVAITVWCPHEDFDRWKLGDGTVNRSTAQALKNVGGREWLGSSGFRVGRVHADLLVRALKTKLVAVRLATQALDAVNRRLGGR
jgi:hypothetical protein